MGRDHPIDEHHQAILPARVWGDGEAGRVRQRAAEEIKDTARAAPAFGVRTAVGFTGSSIRHTLATFPPASAEMIERGCTDFAERWNPILDVFDAEGSASRTKVHPSEIAYGCWTPVGTLDAIGHRPAFGLNFAPSHFVWQDLEPVGFLDEPAGPRRRRAGPGPGAHPDRTARRLLRLGVQPEVLPTAPDNALHARLGTTVEARHRLHGGRTHSVRTEQATPVDSALRAGIAQSAPRTPPLVNGAARPLIASTPGTSRSKLVEQNGSADGTRGVRLASRGAVRGAGPRRPSMAQPELQPGGVESESHPWHIRLVEHPKRFESTHFRAAKDTAHKILRQMKDADLPYGPRPVGPGPGPKGSERWEMHHGGSLWVKGADHWLMFRARVGIEWSMQFCADPAKVDRLRQEAAELLAAFPLTLPALTQLGYEQAEELLRTPIKDADGVEAWTDSLFNSCVPLSHGNHQGILPKVPGEHHYPWPVKGADFVRYDDFQLWVTLPDGTHGAVAPVDRRGSGDGAVRLTFVPEGSEAAPSIAEAEDRRLMAVLPATSDVAMQAFARQIPPGRHTAAGPLATGATRRSSRAQG